MRNKVQLITYANRMSANIAELTQLLKRQLPSYFGGVHLLPFYDSINGEDAGFDPVDHQQVDPVVGEWDDVKALSAYIPVMADLIVNHISSDSPQFQDVLAKGEASQYWHLFLKETDVFEEGVSEADLEALYRPRPGKPFSRYTLAGNIDIQFWTTFSSKQIDINVESEAGQQYLAEILHTFKENGIRTVRLDAAGYAIKRQGTSCFMIDETYEFISKLTDQAAQAGIEILVEIHSHYASQIEIAERVPHVYDFALPPLILHSLYSKDSEALVQWLKQAPRNCITVLDTHDGIGIVDVAKNDTLPGLLNTKQIEELIDQIHKRSNNQSKEASGYSATNVDIYQINCTYYDALGQSDAQYLIARAIQFFAPGVPQVYYMGLFCQPNDMALLRQSGVGRDINRHYFSEQEILDAVARPVTLALLDLIRLRNTATAFGGEFVLEEFGEHKVSMRWIAGDEMVGLLVDLKSMKAEIDYLCDKRTQKYIIADNFLMAKI